MKTAKIKRPDLTKCNLSHIWFETAKGKKRSITKNEMRNGGPGPSVKNYPYCCTRFPTSIRTDVYRRRKDGRYGSKEKIVSMESGCPGDLAVAIVVNSKYTVRLDDAMVIASTACERCMNILAHENGLKWGYSIHSDEAKKARTSCELCK